MSENICNHSYFLNFDNINNNVYVYREMSSSKIEELLEQAEWSSACFNFISILSNAEFPCFLRFTEKRYSDEQITIEKNDVLFLENYLLKYVLKARFSTCDSSCRYVTRLADEEDVFLPLGCTQPGVIKPLMMDFDEVIFHCPRDLGINFPRFVRTMNDVRFIGGQDEQISTFVIPQNDIIEILRWEYRSGNEDPKKENNMELDDSSQNSLSEPLFEIYNNWTNDSDFSSFKTMRLICSWNDKLLALSSNTRIELQGVYDQTQYTILDILERLPSPQAFLFTKEGDRDHVQNTDYSGCYLLKEICPVLLLNGYHIKWKNRTKIERFRIPLVIADANLLIFNLGRITGESLTSERWENDSGHLILRSTSISEPSCTSEIKERRRKTFTSFSGKLNDCVAPNPFRALLALNI